MAMTFDEAMALLGLPSSERDPAVVRAAFLTAVRAHHPDLHPDAATTPTTALVIEAHRLVRSTLAAGGPTDAPATAGAAGDPADPDTPPTADTDAARAPAAPPPWIDMIADDTIEIGLPTDLAYGLLVATAHRVGDVTFVDRSAAVLQILIAFDGEPVCQVVFDLQGRAARGSTEVFCTIESLDDRPPPPVDAVTRFWADHLAATARVDGAEGTGRG